MVKLTLILLLPVVLCMTTCCAHSTNYQEKLKRKSFYSLPNCDKVDGFTRELKDEIRSKSKDVENIIRLVLNGTERSSTYNELANFCDTFGPRLSGSEALNDAIDYMMHKMEVESGLDTHAELAMIPKWTIGKQWASIVSPVPHDMTILAFGKSVGTNKTLEADVEVVHNFKELDDLGREGKLEGKIVVYNYKFVSYGESVKYRTQGAKRASKYGAIAALVRSVTPFSIYSPHTGVSGISIPTAAITLEDADLIQRWMDRRKRVTIRLYIDAMNHPDVESKNLVAEIRGTSKPDEVVLVSGHIDSWYNTQGAMDDGGGMMISYKALDLLKKLNLKAKRTIRAVLWTSEEFGLIGVQKYFKDHQHELDKFKMVMESDLGTFKPLGLSFTNLKPLGQCIVSEVLNLTKSLGTDHLDDNYEGSDIELFTDKGVPGLSLNNDNSRYFYYHHTAGDSISLEDPDELDRSTILWAVASYVLADLSIDLNS